MSSEFRRSMALPEYAAQMDPSRPGWFTDAMADIMNSMEGGPMDWNTVTIQPVDPGRVPWWGMGSRVVKSMIEMPEDGTQIQLCHMALHVVEHALCLRECEAGVDALEPSRQRLLTILRQKYGSGTDAVMDRLNGHDSRDHGLWLVAASMAVDLRTGQEPGTVLNVGHGWDVPQDQWSRTFTEVKHHYDPDHDVDPERMVRRQIHD